MYKSSFLLIISTLTLLGFVNSCSPKRRLIVDKTSPDGTYRVKIELREETGTGTRDYTELLRVQYFKDQRLIDDYEAENADQYEPSMTQGLEVVEWRATNVLHTGESASDQKFSDKIKVSNSTGEHITCMGVSYGKHESFKIFDLAPGAEVQLDASPGFKPDGSSRYFLGYGGETQGGREFAGVQEKAARKSVSEGQFRFEIVVSEKDFGRGIYR